MFKWIFKRIWWKWLKDYKIIQITGWRSCRVDTRGGQRMRVTCIFGDKMRG